jgi:diketogulonate reductase-like aldo/keto reductase
MIEPTFIYGTAWKEEDTARCVRDALVAGFRAIDTANQRVHYHEAAVGAAIRQAFEDGLVNRDDLFVQTKFTPRAGQDHRLPYDPDASVETQVRQSFESSLEHLGVDRLDAYLLHGPFSPVGIGEADREVWRSFEALREEGKVRRLGVSNVSVEQLRAFHAEASEPLEIVQNRCFATSAWDGPVREYCREHGIVYQGFSLLTANLPVLRSPAVTGLAERLDKTPAQIVFRFAIDAGMVPLTGTTDPRHMEQDLAVLDFTLPPDDVLRVERIAAR